MCLWRWLILTPHARAGSRAGGEAVCDRQRAGLEPAALRERLQLYGGEPNGQRPACSPSSQRRVLEPLTPSPPPIDTIATAVAQALEVILEIGRAHGMLPALLEVPTLEGQRALHFAVLWDAVEHAKLLLDGGAVGAVFSVIGARFD